MGNFMKSDKDPGGVNTGVYGIQGMINEIMRFLEWIPIFLYDIMIEEETKVEPLDFYLFVYAIDKWTYFFDKYWQGYPCIRLILRFFLLSRRSLIGFRFYLWWFFWFRFFLYLWWIDCDTRSFFLWWGFYVVSTSEYFFQ